MMEVVITDTDTRKVVIEVGVDGAVWIRRWAQNTDGTITAGELTLNPDEVVRLVSGRAWALDTLEAQRAG